MSYNSSMSPQYHGNYNTAMVILKWVNFTITNCSRTGTVYADCRVYTTVQNQWEVCRLIQQSDDMCKVFLLNISMNYCGVQNGSEQDDGCQFSPISRTILKSLINTTFLVCKFLISTFIQINNVQYPSWTTFTYT